MNITTQRPWFLFAGGAIALPLFVTLGCTAQIGAGAGNGVPPTGSGGGKGSDAGTVGSADAGAAGGNSGTTTTGAGGAAAMGGATSNGGASGTTLIDNGLPGRALIRRLSNIEFDATIATLLGDSTGYSSGFPSDTAVNGFTNNTDVQDVASALSDAYLAAAEQIATKATQNTDTVLGCKLTAGETCIADFITRFGQRAWRRPVNSTEQTDLMTVFRSGRDGFDATTGVQLLIESFLLSPNFLYRPEIGVPVAGTTYSALTSWEIASRLSYFLTGSMPDDKLLAVAQANGLNTPEGIISEAKRLLATSQARTQVGQFFAGWLDLKAVDRLQRDKTQFPNWNSNLPTFFAAETRSFATSVVFDEAGGDLTTLLTAPYTYGDPSLAAYYGGTAGTAKNGIARITLPPAQRAGLLTQGGFLAAHAKEIATDPVARGKFVRERMLCQGLPAPPTDLVITAPVITPGTTTRQRFAQHESEPTCAVCHTMIDPVGLAFEHYDAAGQWRDKEQGLDIDASGNLTKTDVAGPLDGVVQMASKLSQSNNVATCFVRQWFRFAFGRAESDSDDPRIGTITTSFAGAKGRVQDLLVALTTTPDFRYLAKGTM